MNPGDHVTIIDGPFAKLPTVVVRDQGQKVVLKITIFGRDTEATLAREQLLAGGLSLDTLAAQISDAVSRRGLHQRVDFFWRQTLRGRRDDPSDRELPRLAERFGHWEAAQVAARDAEAAVIIARLRADYGPLDDEERRVRWLAERESHLSWQEQANATSVELAAFAPEPPVGTREFDHHVARVHALRDRVLGWRRRQRLDEPAPHEERSAELEAAIEASPMHEEPYLVYGDWLQSRGNLRGELISMHARQQPAPALEARALGPLADFADALDAKWRLGFLESLRIETTRDDERDGIDAHRLLRALWPLTSARFLERLTVACPSVHGPEATAQLAETFRLGARSSLRHLRLETNTGNEMLSWTTAGDLGALGRSFPNLESLWVNAGEVALTAPAFAKLTHLDLRTTQLTAATLEALTSAEWPALRHLGLWVGSRAYDVVLTVDQLRPLLASPRMPHLESLGIANCEFTDELCALLPSLPLVPRLRMLDLSMGTMSESGATALVANANLLRHLTRIDVDDNYLSAQDLEALKRALPSVVSRSQREPETWEGAVHRYASIGE